MIMMAVKIALSEMKELMAWCETIEIDGLLQKANNITHLIIGRKTIRSQKT